MDRVDTFSLSFPVLHPEKSNKGLFRLKKPCPLIVDSLLEFFYMSYSWSGQIIISKGASGRDIEYHCKNTIA
jgi:hypothetical protein